MRSLRGMDVRPTSDRLRETLYNVLTAGNPAALEETVWLDLFAGTGAVGIEALSRGASFVHFVESSASAATLIKRNLQSLGIGEGWQVSQQDVSRSLRKLEAGNVRADFVFLDPPYRMEEAYRSSLEFLAQSRLLKAGTLVIAEHEKKFDPGEDFPPLRRFRKLVQGDTALSFYRFEPESSS